MKTKEQAVREELQTGASDGLLPDLVRAYPGLSVARLTALAEGAEFEPYELERMWTYLELDDSVLEDKPDPEAPSERDGVRSWIVEFVHGVEGPSLSLSPTSKSSGTRIAGPKPWGGGYVTKTWAIDPQDIFEALGFTQNEAKVLANAVEGFRKINEVKYPALYPTS